MKRVLALYLVAIVAGTALVLAACGGGGCDPCEPEAPPPKVNCQTKPEACR